MLFVRRCRSDAGRRAGSGAVAASMYIQCREPKTGQQKVYEDDPLGPSMYIIYLYATTLQYSGTPGRLQ